jgi:hypothetical protein
MYPNDRVAQLYPQAPGSLFVAFYDLQGYGGGILTCLHTVQTDDCLSHLSYLSFSKIYLCLSIKYIHVKLKLKPLTVIYGIQNFEMIGASYHLQKVYPSKL